MYAVYSSLNIDKVWAAQPPDRPGRVARGVGDSWSQRPQDLKMLSAMIAVRRDYVETALCQPVQEFSSMPDKTGCETGHDGESDSM